MLLQNKTALIFAASGEIATAVAHAMAEQGAKVFLSARQLDKIIPLAEKIRASGAEAHAHQVDALNETEIDHYLEQIIAVTGRVDVVFNGIGLDAMTGGYGLPATEIGFNQFMLPLQTMLASQFLTSRCAARKMIATASRGTILLLTASLSRLKMPNMSGITAACTAIEGLTRSLAGELGHHGIRAICLNPTAIQESRTIQETNAQNAKAMGISAEEMAAGIGRGNLLGKGPSLQDIGKFAAFLASDAGSILNSHVVDADFGNATVI